MKQYSPTEFTNQKIQNPPCWNILNQVHVNKNHKSYENTRQLFQIVIVTSHSKPYIQALSLVQAHRLFLLCVPFYPKVHSYIYLYKQIFFNWFPSYEYGQTQSITLLMYLIRLNIFFFLSLASSILSKCRVRGTQTSCIGANITDGQVTGGVRPELGLIGPDMQRCRSVGLPGLADEQVNFLM